MARHRTVDGFTAAIQSFVDKKAPEAAEKVVRKISVVAYGMLVSHSPRKDGTFQANWYPAVNSLPAQYSPTKTNVSAIQLPAFKIGDTIVHGNNSPYGKRLEGGWSKQAPQGIVAPVKRKLINMLRGKKI